MASQRISKAKRKVQTQVPRQTNDESTSVSSTELESAALNLSENRFHLLMRILFYLFVFSFWTFRYGNFLYIVQEYDLFVWDQSFLFEASTRAAGVSRYLSSFIVQFFYYPLVGAAILAGFASFIQYGTEKLFRFQRRSFFLSFVPSVLLTLQITCVNYFIFERIDIAYLFSFTFNYAFMLAFVLGFDSCQNQRSRTRFLVIGSLLTYPVFGFFTLFADILCVLKELPEALTKERTPSPSQRRSKGADSKTGKTGNPAVERLELLALFTLVAPALFWPLYSGVTPSLQHLYGAGLWEESPLTEGREISTNVVFTACQIGIIVFFSISAFAEAARNLKRLRKTGNASVQNKSSKTSRFWNYVSFVLIIAIFGAMFALSYSSSNFQELLRIGRALDKEDWDEILNAESRISAPSNPAITARYLALYRKNRLAEEIFNRPAFPKESMQLLTVNTFGMCGDRILYEFGLVNGAERAAFNNYVAKRERSYWALKTLALCAAADGRRSLAERYLSRIQKTLFHRSFADETLDFLRTEPDSQDTFAPYVKASVKTSEKRLSEISQSFVTVRKLAPLTDDLESTSTPNAVLYGLLHNEEIFKRSVSDQENRLAFLLLMRHLPEFSRNFDEYVKQKGSEHIPRYLQEAALLREKAPKLFSDGAEDRWSLPSDIQIDDAIRERFEKYQTVAPIKFKTPEAASDIQKEFGDTFWFFMSLPYAVDNY